VRKLLLTAVLVALCAFGAWGLDPTDYVSGRYFTTPWGTVLAGFTSTGLFDLIGGARFDNVTSSSTLTITEDTITLVGDAYNYGDSFKIGYDSGAYISFAVADTTGNVTITQTGSTKNVSWTTAGSFTLSAGSFALTAASQTFTASTAWYAYTPAFYIGYDSGAWLKIAVADTTGNVTITQTGSNKSVTWTAPGGLNLGTGITVTGNIDDVTGTNDGVLYVSQFTVTYAQTASYTVCTIPANADVLKIEVLTTTAFSGGSATTIDIGWSGNTDKYANDLDIRSAGYAVATGYGYMGDVGGSDRDILAQITTDDSAGSATILVYWTRGTPGTP